MKKVLCNILGLITHPLLLLVYLSVALLFTRNFQYFSAAITVQFVKYLFLSVIVIPIIIYFVTRLLQNTLFKSSGRMTMLVAFAVYFAILSFFGRTPFAAISIMQQLPLVILLVAMILENRKILQINTLCLSGLAMTIIFTSIFLKANYLALLIAVILATGLYNFLLLECEKSSVKTLSINCLLGTAASVIFFLLILK